MNDPLSLLRRAVINKSYIENVNGMYAFDGHQFPENTLTCFRRTLKDSTDYYTLRDVIFFHENSETLSFVDYRKKVLAAKGVKAITEHDRQNLKDYLNGLISECPQIDIIAAAAYVHPTKAKENAAEVAQASSSSAEMITDDLAKPVNPPIATEGAPRDPRRAEKRLSSAIHQSQVSMDTQAIEADRKVLTELRARDFPAANRNSVLRAPGADFSFILKLVNDHILKPQDSSANKAAAEPDSKRLKSDPSNSATRAITATPIIIIPSALTSVITMVNVADFLEKGSFVTVEEKMKEGAKRDKEVTIQRTTSDKRIIKYKIIDNHRLLKEEDWDRVVAVFALGQQWQFKDWKWSNPVDLFRNVLGVHVTMDDRNIEPTIQSWNCRILKIYRFKRHMDEEATNEFWALLDEFVKLRKPNLANAGVISAPKTPVK